MNIIFRLLVVGAIYWTITHMGFGIMAAFIVTAVVFFGFNILMAVGRGVGSIFSMIGRRR